MPLRVAFYTLGCKLNQLETESFADAFARSGATVLELSEPGADGCGAPDLVIVNSCTVTSKAEQKARRIIRVALAENREAIVIITGCYAQVDAAALSALDERALVLPGERKSALLDLPSYLSASGGGSDLLGLLRAWLSGASGPGPFAFNPQAFSFHARPSLKIQDGCDNECAYCRVHIARGKSLSLPSSQVLERARSLEAAGRAEIVLAGVNLSQYRDGDIDFPGLLRVLLRGTERIAFRISSYEPDAMSEDFFEVFSEKRIRPHLHLALQSGSDSVLSAMGRRYGSAEILSAVEKIRRARRDPFIACDLISGFPGETEADAASTLELARRIDFAWIHAFRFSPRPGTKAASMPHPVPERVAGERVGTLLEQGRSGRARYLARWGGEELSAVLESDFRATSENFLKLRVKGLPETTKPGQGIRCRIETKAIERASVDENEGVDCLAEYIESIASR
jgi:threonylcarbamoyladenosine tRNA methylthiotransferase MtaB